jgi:phospho-N-acetylmuramoyl-pentapeptide-transferase
VIYYFLYPLHVHEPLSFLNVLRYVPFRVMAGTMTAMLLTFGLYPWFIRTLQSRQIGQVVRHDGPDSHLSKSGTPTMGGSLILLALIGGTVLWADPRSTMVWLATVVTALYGAIGYADDALKISRQHSAGLSLRAKLLLQFPVAIAVCAYLWYGDTGLPSDWLVIRDRISVPFVAFQKHPMEIPGFVYAILATIFIVGMSNAVNLTDGLDGLAIGPVMINAGTYLVLA